MSAETVNTLAAAGTFVVITVTAIAALIQLRHMRLSNQLQALLELTDRWNGQSLQRSVTYVLQELPNKVSSPEYERSLRATALITSIIRSLRCVHGGSKSEAWSSSG